jgi:multiple sugar transport system ATP-binding protein
MTVWKNLAFGLRMRKIPRQEIEKRVENAAEALHLVDLLKRRPAELSGGQRQRVALGRALVREPAVFLMDEPLSNLDANLRAEMRSEIRRLQQEIGTTTVYVTHDQVEAMTMGDRIAVMREGKLLQAGGLTEIYEDPANTFVAGFIGSPGMSLGRWDVEERASELRLHRGACNLTIDTQGRDQLHRGEVVIGVRPEDAHLWQEARGMLGPLRGEAVMVEVFGREVFITVKCDAGRYVIESARAVTRPRIGEKVEFGFDPGRLCVFDSQSSDAIGRL